MRRVPRVIVALRQGGGMIAALSGGAKAATHPAEEDHRMPDITRRGLIQAAGALAAGIAAPGAAAAAAPAASGAVAPAFRLGIVTYMIAADWDVPTILR